MKMKNRKQYYLMLAALLTALLSGCAAKPEGQGTLNRQQRLEKKLKVMQAQVVHTEQALKKEKGELSTVGSDALIQDLSQAQIQVVQVGQTVRVIMPSDNLFMPHSANIKAEYVNLVMPMVTKLIRHYSKVNVAVIAYGDYTHDIKRAKALTSRQAQVIASELWARGINARLLYAEGKGVKHPIATNQMPQGRFANRRVEICFHYDVPRVM